MTTDDAIMYLVREQGVVRFISVHGADRVTVQLPGWGGYFVERDTFLDAVCAAKERRDREIVEATQ